MFDKGGSSDAGGLSTSAEASSRVLYWVGSWSSSFALLSLVLVEAASDVGAALTEAFSLLEESENDLWGEIYVSVMDWEEWVDALRLGRSWANPLPVIHHCIRFRASPALKQLTSARCMDPATLTSVPSSSVMFVTAAVSASCLGLWVLIPGKSCSSLCTPTVFFRAEGESKYRSCSSSHRNINKINFGRKEGNGCCVAGTYCRAKYQSGGNL